MNFAQHLILVLCLSSCFFAHAQDAKIPPPKTSLLKTAETKNFNKPMSFDQVDNGVLLSPPELDYDLSDGNVLKIGNLTFEGKNFFFTLLPLGKTHSQLTQVLSGDEASKMTLVMVWPEALLSHGTVEMISRTGKVLWTYSFSEEDRRKWRHKIENWRQQLVAKGVPSKTLSLSGIFAAQFAIDVESAKIPFRGLKESFRFCVTQAEGRNSTKMCSQSYGVKTSGRNVVMAKTQSDSTEPRVLVQNEEAPLSKNVPFVSDLPVSFYAELSSGESYEFVAQANKLELMDISDTQNPDVLRIVGYGTRPVGYSTILNPDQYGPLTRALGFESTIGDSRKFWEAAIQKEDPKIYLPGQGGGIFKQKFELSEIPRAQYRVYLSSRTPSGTYIDGIRLDGHKQPAAKVSSAQNYVKENPKNPVFFTWNFAAPERGKINRSYLNVEIDGKVYKSFYEIYKGYPRELSGRFTGVQASGSFIVLGEIAYNQWFEDLFDWTNYWLSQQRWGMSAKSFQSFNQLKVDSAGNTAPLSVTTVDVKYRATPGLWGRDESVGGVLSYQSVSFGAMKAPMLGLGAFWARSMPRAIDNFFNLVPIMRYPKWVDMEFIYYLNSMDSKVALNSSLSLNFHGKVLWSEHIFGEAGFGLKRYGFSDASVNQKAELNSFYGTVGLGVNF